MGEENVTNEQLVAWIQAGVDVPDNMLRLWEQNRGYIALVAKNYQAFEDIEDLKQEGYIGLCRAVDEYKPQEGVAFMTYAGYWIRQRIYSRAISGTGLTSFEHSWTSATERAALQEL